MSKPKRRIRGEGSIGAMRPDGRIEVRLPLPKDSDGKRRRLIRWAKSRQEARALLDTMRAEAKGYRAGATDLTVTRFFEDRWLPVMRSELRGGTWAVYRSNVRRHILPVIGDVRLKDLTPEHAELVKAQALKSVKPRTARLVRMTLATALKRAEMWQIPGVTNVVRFSKPPRVERREYRFLSEREAKTLLAAAKGSPYATLYLVTLSLGLRLGEVLGLCWSDVDLDKGELTVRHSMRHDGGQLKLMEPKTESSRATIPMTEPVRAALAELKAKQAYEKMLVPVWQDSWGLCFTSAVGEYIPRSRLYADYRAVLTAAGLGRLRFHDLRHSTGSILFAQGVPMKVIQMVLRHGQISTTMDTYIHLRSEGLNEAKAAMERALG